MILLSYLRCRMLLSFICLWVSVDKWTALVVSVHPSTTHATVDVCVCLFVVEQWAFEGDGLLD